MLGREGGSAMDTGKVAMQVLQWWDSDTITNGYNENHNRARQTLQSSETVNTHTHTQTDIITAPHMAHGENTMLIP